MKKAILLFVGAISLALNAQQQDIKMRAELYQNPIFAGDYPDPSIIRDGEDYYIVHSSFNYYPGLLIWTSKDLINWKPVTHALKKSVGSVWAPDLVKFNTKFYIYFPANETNYVVSADNINGPWSDPIDLKIGNIDPGHFTDEKGNRYLYFSNGDFVPLSKDGLSVSGTAKHVYDGWKIPSDWSVECFCMEGPKMLKHGNYYYLTVAEGGTAGPATSHMVISARSKSPLGPWENSPYNPVIKTKDSSEKWWSKGHATLIDDVNGKWWMVFHGYEKDYYNMGRQTLLQPVEWKSDGWFKAPQNIKTEEPIKRPAGKITKSNFILSDTFSGTELGPQWQFFNQYDPERFKLTPNGIRIKGKGNGIGDSSPLLCTPSDHSYSTQVEVDIEGNASAGLILFYDSKLYTGIAADKENILAILRSWQFPTQKGINKTHLLLRLEKKEQLVNMFYSLNGKDWIKIENSAEVSSFHHNALSGFMSLRIGLSAVGEGQVTFRNFVYKPLNEVIK
ncbi:family 43 glycosylhydrolase [Flavobacterium sp. CLA17]|uniref:family 43 glycosylhydrolase n=1 Tax=Flavobacterium sp. CLA17 TaxID=2724135 RepID=UPI001492AB52|nr:family 43 glycosylhydrolase [Flavobacterium sp. CLA17]QSB27531.1 family 43 glycosylhydrolase [Flavobacterium sp. CLA17]